MSNRVHDDLKKPFMTSAGWLFADLLLALAMLFLIANTVTLPKPPTVAVKPTATPTPTLAPTPTFTPTPSPTPVLGQRVLESQFCRITLTDSSQPDTLANNFDFAKTTIEPQINGIGFLKGRKVGTVIAFGGVDDVTNPNDQTRGVGMASQVYKVLQDMEASNPNSPFHGASYYDPLFTGYTGSGNIRVDIYLVERPGSKSNTCDSNHNVIQA